VCVTSDLELCVLFSLPTDIIHPKIVTDQYLLKILILMFQFEISTDTPQIISDYLVHQQQADIVSNILTYS
jgi:hypothetical protein